MKLIHLGYYTADYPSLGLADVDPGGEVEFTDTERAARVMSEGIFGPGDPESRKLLVDVLTAQEASRLLDEQTREREVAEENAQAEADASRAAAEQAERAAAARADVEAAQQAALRAAKKAVAEAGKPEGGQ